MSVMKSATCCGLLDHVKPVQVVARHRDNLHRGTAACSPLWCRYMDLCRNQQQPLSTGPFGGTTAMLAQRERGRRRPSHRTWQLVCHADQTRRYVTKPVTESAGND